MNSKNSFLTKSNVIGRIPREKVEVLVILLCFNQGLFLRQALESVLAQDFQGSMTIVIHDDASVDNSQSLIRELVAEHPDRLFAINQQENVFSKGVNILGEIQNLCKSNLVARLDADDYWFSKNKLTEQVNIFHNNPQIAISTHPYFVLNETSGTFQRVEILRKGLINPNLLALGNFICSPTVIYRVDCFLPLPTEFTHFYIQDWPLWAVISSRGEIHSASEIYSVYRQHENNGFSRRKNLDFLTDTLGANRMLADFLKGNLGLTYRIMFYLRFTFGHLDRWTGSKASAVLNQTCNRIIRIAKKDIADPGT